MVATGGKIFRILMTGFMAGLWLGATAMVQSSEITLASTTSTENSGLFSQLLPRFKAETGISVRVIAVGTGQAIRLAERGDADVLLVHHRPSEEKFVAAGYGVKRYNVMYNDFVLIGAANDSARVAGGKDVVAALKKIATVRASFVSRGDESGTHKKEVDLWRIAGINIGAASGTWYREVGAGMGATLNIAAAQDAYVLSDRATWISFNNKRDLKLVLSGDSRLFNQYGVIAVNPARHAHVKHKEAERFVSWLTSKSGQASIGAFTVSGQKLFVPNATIQAAPASN
ncbi:MAG: substrate-binding domain-containing protein [Proteobacteria bacterium]|nr:substrate-binding domain-containing protein [Pseudomonadota bacterium]